MGMPALAVSFEMFVLKKSPADWALSTILTIRAREGTRKMLTRMEGAI